MPSPTAWIAVLSQKIDRSPLPVGPAAAAGVEQARVDGPRAAVHVDLPLGRARSLPCSYVAMPGRALAADGQLGLHRRQADPVLLEDLLVARVVERVRVLLRCVYHQVRLERCGSLSRQVRRPGEVAPSPLELRHVGEVVQPPDVVDGVVELLRRPCPVRSTLPSPRASRRRRRPASPHVCRLRLREVVHLVAEPVVAGPAPDQGHGARELHRLVGVEVVRPVASWRARTRSSRR